MENAVRVAGEQGVAVPGGMDEARFLLGRHQHGGVGGQAVVCRLRYQQIGFKAAVGDIEVDRDVDRHLVGELERHFGVVLREQDIAPIRLRTGADVLREEECFLSDLQFTGHGDRALRQRRHRCRQQENQ